MILTTQVSFPGHRAGQKRDLGASKDSRPQGFSLMCFQQQLRNQLSQEMWCWAWRTGHLRQTKWLP